MAISCFTGKPGNGKTLTMMHFLTEDLIRTERHIVTNIPVKLPELAEYLENETTRRKTRCPDLNKRLTVIDTTEALYFWRYRSGNFVLPRWEGKGQDGKMLSEEDLLIESRKYWEQIGVKREYAQPVSYYISEAHRYYNAKRFQRISVIAELYVTHHRHLHDEVYFDTQFPKQLAVALRELTEEWHVLRNDYNRNIGLIKMIPRIRMSSFYEMPSGSSNKPFAKRSVHIRENGVAGCYESTGALGVIERTQDTETKKKKRGLDLRLFIVMIVLGVVGATSLFAFGSKQVLGLMFGGSVLKDQPQNENSNFTQNSQSSKLSALAAQEALEAMNEAQDDLTLTTFQFLVIGGKLSFRGILSNGIEVTQNTKGFAGANPDTRTIRLNGREIPFVSERDIFAQRQSEEPVHRN